MYGRFLGYYNLKDVITYTFPNREPVSETSHYLPSKKAYFFSSGREALYVALLHRKSLSKKQYVVIPGWGCPIVLATIFKSGFTPLLMDISTKSLHIDIDQLVELTNHYDIDSVILIAENGIPYSSDEMTILKKSGLNVIADYAVGWQNLNIVNEHTSDFEMFSGGFSKPISGLGLGVLTTDYDIHIPTKLPKKQAPFPLMRILIHVILQKKWIYDFIQPYIPQDLQKEFDGKIHNYAKRSISIVVNSLVRYTSLKEDWKRLQDEIRTILLEKQSQSPLVYRGECLHTKVIFENRLLKPIDKPLIEFHHQYQYSLFDDVRCMKINSDYKNIKRLKNEFISISINNKVIKERHDFFKGFSEALV